MDFKSIMSLFREDDWTRELVEMLVEMLDLSSQMYGFTMGVVINGDPDQDPNGQLFERDKKINHLMRQIRRRVIARLSVGGQGGEVPTALIFFNAVKDAERIGDYIKNLHEILEMMPESPDRSLYKKWLQKPSDTTAELLELTRQGFAESDDDIAAEIIAATRRLNRQCEKDIRTIADEDLGTHDAVSLVLALRFIKRISSHLSNIATTVVMPVDLLDFHDESL